MTQIKVLYNIDLGNGMSVEYHSFLGLRKEWYFCRNGDPIREINSDYLEGAMLKKIVALELELDVRRNLDDTSHSDAKE